MEYEVVLTRRAEQDLGNIWLYLHAKAPEEATPFCQKLLERAFSLKLFPEGYPRLWCDRKVHHLAFGDYSIIYAVKKRERQVSVYRFWHAAQNPRRFRLQESTPVYGDHVIETSR